MSVSQYYGFKYKTLFTYYNKISEKFVRYFLIYVAFCFKAPFPALSKGEGAGGNNPGAALVPLKGDNKDVRELSKT